MIGWGLFFVVLGGILFFYFRELEQGGDSIRRMNLIIALLYRFLGKYGVLAILGGLGSLMVISGIKDMRSK